MQSAWEEIDEIIFEIENTNLTNESKNLVEQYQMQASELSIKRDKAIELAVEIERRSLLSM